MSRSYKHTPRSGQRKNKFIKQYAKRDEAKREEHQQQMEDYLS